MMGKKYDFDKLFDGAHDTVEYWQERHDIAHGEMLARDAEIAALKARIAELEAFVAVLRTVDSVGCDLPPGRRWLVELPMNDAQYDAWLAMVSPLPEPSKPEDAP